MFANIVLCCVGGFFLLATGVKVASSQDDDKCFCMKKKGFYSDKTNSCFVRFESKKTYEQSHEACKAESSDGWTGRLAILPTREVFDSVKKNFPKINNHKEQTWVALKAKVLGSNAKSDWFWYNGSKPVLPHTYGMIHLDDDQHNCARYLARMKNFADRNCSFEFARLCEFVFEKSQSGLCDVDKCFCMKKNGFHSDKTNSCFVRFESKKPYDQSQEACKAESSNGWTGRLAILPTREVLQSVRKNVAQFDANNEQTWVALKAKVLGSNAQSDWFWYDGTKPLIAHTYGMAKFNDNQDDCARYRAKSKDFGDRNCSSFKFARLCEFVFEPEQSASCVCNNGDNDQNVCTYCLVGSYTSTTTPFYSTYEPVNHNPYVLNTNPSAVVHVMRSGLANKDNYLVNYESRSFKPLCNSTNAVLTFGQKSTDGRRIQTDVEAHLTDNVSMIHLSLYCNNGILSGKVFFQIPGTVNTTQKKIDGDIYSIKCS